MLLQIIVFACVALRAVVNAQVANEPDAAADLEVTFVEDTRPNYLQHAVLTFSWTPPQS